MACMLKYHLKIWCLIIHKPFYEAIVYSNTKYYFLPSIVTSRNLFEVNFFNLIDTVADTLLCSQRIFYKQCLKLKILKLPTSLLLQIFEYNDCVFMTTIIKKYPQKISVTGTFPTGLFPAVFFPARSFPRRAFPRRSFPR